MPWENIGECGGAQLPHERDRMIAEVELGAAYVRLICGAPPEGCRVGVMWHEHDGGRYATVGLHFETEEPPWRYLSCAGEALRCFDEAVDWSPMDEVDEDADAEDDESGPDGQDPGGEPRNFPMAAQGPAGER